MTPGRPCQHCGGPLPEGAARDRRYCSERCKHRSGDAKRKASRQARWPAYRKPRVAPAGPDGGTCPGCGSPVEQILNGTKTYCTRACRVRSRNAQRRAATAAKQTGAPLACAACGRPVGRPSAHGPTPTLCRACRTPHGNRKPDPAAERPCAWCGRPFRRPDGGRCWTKTCSPLCHRLRFNARKLAYQKLHPRANRGQSDADRAKGRERQRLNTARRKEREAVAGIEQLSVIANREGVGDA